MRNIITTTILAAGLACALPSCTDEHTDFQTRAVVHLTAPDGCTIVRLQGTVHLTNLNTKQTFATSAFDGLSAELDVFRGVYSAQVEGSLRYTDPNGVERVASYRASTPYCELLAHPAELTLSISFL